LNCTGI